MLPLILSPTSLRLDSATEGNLANVLPGEGAVRIAPEIVRAALAHLM